MKLVIGLGTGRCGTMSLASLLDAQEMCKVHHEARTYSTLREEEFLPWTEDTEALWRRIGIIERDAQPHHELVGDVAFFYLPYVEELDFKRDCVFICLRRDRESTVESYIRKTDPRNHWQHKGKPDKIWDKCYPITASNNESKREAIRKYWDLYYREAEKLESTYNNFKVFDIQCLNKESGISEILSFCGIPESRMNIIKFRSNASKNREVNHRNSE